MGNFKTLVELKNFIHHNLTPHITSDFILLDIPNHINVGDQLIYLGELDFFKGLKYKCLEISSVTYGYRYTKKAGTILLHGGGNFGDLYPLHQNYREEIILNNLDKKIIILPQSLHFKSIENLHKSIAIFNQHKQLTICLRDQSSYDLLVANQCTNNLILMPDMAFCSQYARTHEPTKDLLLLQRLDIEKNDAKLNFEGLDFDLRDWPTFEKSNKELLFRIWNKLNTILSKALAFNGSYGLIPLRNENDYALIGMDFLSPYKFVISNRLHGHILALLMGVPTILVDNSYGKNKRFYDAWLSELPQSHFASSFEEAIVLYKKLTL